MLNVKALLYKICNQLNDQLVVTTATGTTSSTPAAGSNTTVTTATQTKAGYYPLGVVGFWLNRTAVTCRGCYLTNVTNGSCTVDFALRNDSSSAAAGAVTCTAFILWVKL